MKRVVCHGTSIIRVERNGLAGKIDIENTRTKVRAVCLIDDKGVFRQQDRNTVDRKVLKRALQTYDSLGGAN